MREEKWRGTMNKKLNGLSINNPLKKSKKSDSNTMECDDTSKKDDIYFSGSLHNAFNALHLIKGNVEILKDEVDNENILSIVEKIQISVERMEDIIMGLLKKGKIESINVKSEFSLNQLIKEIDSLHKGESFYDEKVEKSFQYDCTHKIKGRYIDFFQSVNNLIKNAVEAMVDSFEKKLFVKTYCDEDNCYVSIRDTGCGISDENLNKIFLPFFSTKSSNLMTDKFGNIGMGLTITKQILMEYRAEITVQSKLNVGSNFIIKIPRKQKN
jgi:signal transduction histidine kinase